MLNLNLRSLECTLNNTLYIKKYLICLELILFPLQKLKLDRMCPGIYMYICTCIEIIRGGLNFKDLK